MARYDDDDDAFDERGLLRDGRRSRVPMMMRDGMSDVQRAVAEDKAARQFDDSAARHQPGPIFADRSAAREAYEDAKREAQEAWRTPAADADAADQRRRRKVQMRDPRGRETGSAEWEEEDDSAARDAAPTVPRTMTVDEARAIKRRAYDEMVARDRDAWKTL